MAKLPQWDMEVVPDPKRLIVRPAGGGQAMQALAGLGRDIAQLGAWLTQEGREADQKTKELDTQRRTSELVRKEREDFNKVNARINQTAEPEGRSDLWDQWAAGQADRLAQWETDEEVRNRAQEQLNRLYNPSWDEAVRLGVVRQRLEEASRHTQALREEGLRTRDTGAYFEWLEVLVAQGAMTGQQAADEKAAYAPLVENLLRQDMIAQEAQLMPYGQGVEFLNSPGVQELLATLDPQARQEFLDKQTALLRRQAAAAAQAERQVEEKRTAAGVQAITEAYAGRFDATAGLALVEQGILRPAEYGEALKIAEKGPRTENDPPTYAKLHDLLDDLQAGRVAPEKVRSYALANASKLKPATLDSAIEATAKLADPQERAIEELVQQAARELVTVTDSTLQMLMGLSAGKDVISSAEDQRARQWRQVDWVRQQLRSYRRANPKATADDLYLEGRRILRHLRTRPAPEREAEIEAWETQLLARADLRAAPEPTGEGLAAYYGYPEPGPAPAGLEPVWDSLSDREKAQALELLRLGFTAAQIIEELQ